MQETKNISDYRRSLRERIVETAMQLFAQRGVKAVKMDDIAQSLQISKRTLYEIYQNKEEVLFEGIKQYDNLRRSQFKAYVDEGHNVMEIILEFYRRKTEEAHQVNPCFFSDIQKYPSIVAYMHCNHQEAHEQFLAFMKRGVDEGYFLSMINYEIVGQVFEALNNHIVSKELYSKYTIEELFINLLFVTLRGFCTEKGVKVLDEAIF